MVPAIIRHHRPLWMPSCDGLSSVFYFAYSNATSLSGLVVSLKTKISFSIFSINIMSSQEETSVKNSSKLFCTLIIATGTGLCGIPATCLRFLMMLMMMDSVFRKGVYTCS